MSCQPPRDLANDGEEEEYERKHSVPTPSKIGINAIRPEKPTPIYTAGKKLGR